TANKTRRVEFDSRQPSLSGVSDTELRQRMAWR
ncbi:uncharacterized, partial [Tachysurus ichikawai]